MAIQFNLREHDQLPNLEVHLLGRRITCMTVPAVVEAIYAACTEDRKMVVANYNVHGFNLTMQFPWFYNFLQSADITHCDSSGILKAIRYMGLDLPIQYRVSYTRLMPALLECCNRHGLSMFLLGAKPENLEAALVRMKEKYPNARFAGHHGYFTKEDSVQNEAVVQQINSIKPNILIVGMGMPLQGKWIQQHRSRLNVNVCMPGGAIIDRLAGVVSDCPTLISNMGFEWLYRLGREPRRLAARYLLGNLAFVLHIAMAKYFANELKVEVLEPTGSLSLEAKDDGSQLSSVSAASNVSTV